MSTIVKPIPHTVDLNEPVKKTYIDTLLATEDNLAHRFDITLIQGVPSGAAVNAYFIRYNDNATISLTGTVSGNVASVTLNKPCYNKAGQYAIIIKVVADGVTNTVFYGEGTIFTSMTDTILDPENVVPSLSDLLAQIAAMEEATAASKAATTNAKTATTRANNAAAKIEGMTASAVKAEEAGVTVSEVNGVKHFAFDLPRGEKGEKGDPGTIENVTVTSIHGLPEALDHLTQQMVNYRTAVNLLDNSDFRNPVNQRGQTSYNSAGYTIDRWTKESNAILTIADDCINIDNSANSADEVICQKVDSDTAEKMIGKTVTIAICTSDGTVYANSGIVVYDAPVARIELNGFSLQLHFFRTAESYQMARLVLGAGLNISVKWISLYEGTYTADTLPPYVPKGYAAELLAASEYATKAYVSTAITEALNAIQNASGVSF